MTFYLFEHLTDSEQARAVTLMEGTGYHHGHVFFWLDGDRLQWAHALWPHQLREGWRVAPAVRRQP